MNCLKRKDAESEPLLSSNSNSYQATLNSNNDVIANTRHLSTFFGVVVPCVLSMFSVILFLRMGFIVGQAGLLLSLAMLVLAYAIIALTVLSVCAIATNGAIEGGGAYFMISRALGPEFGGGIGLMFFLANVAAAALYIFGIVEAMASYFGPNGVLASDQIPTGSWYNFGYGSAILFACFIVCLVGAEIYAKTTFLIFLVVVVSVASVIVSFFAKKPFTIVPKHTPNTSFCNYSSIYYTGFNSTTLKNNEFANFTEDVSTDLGTSFVSVFAVLFNGCTGIMAGANMSGELKNPSRSIPLGTILACGITGFVYMVLILLISATSPRQLLQCDYSFLISINLWHPFVAIGVFLSSLSATLSSFIGASRILLALSRDQVFGCFLNLVRITTASGNPYVAVAVTWFLIQMVLFAQKVNTIAPVVTIFFLFAYAAVDMSCLALEWASAPNFRPTFKYFTWHTCLLGMISCVLMMFLIQPIYATVSFAVLIVLVIVIHYLAPTTSWGYISQALIFHQVRKYMLMLDVRKEHVKFWRPQILLMVKNPRTSCQLIDFINSIKKSGLYILGHVSLGKLGDMKRDLLNQQQDHWLNLVDELGVKAFVELTLSNSVREGTEHLLRISGLGGMKPNTLVIGFYDDEAKVDTFQQLLLFHDKNKTRSHSVEDANASPRLPRGTSADYFPLLSDADRKLQASEYVSIIVDAIKLNKNVCLARYFSQLNKDNLVKCRKVLSSAQYIDVWPMNFLKPVIKHLSLTMTNRVVPQSPSPFDMGGVPVETSAIFDVTSVFLMQMACILNMSMFWKSNARLRINICSNDDVGKNEEIIENLKTFLRTIRIKAKIRNISWNFANLVQPDNVVEGKGESSINSASHHVQSDVLPGPAYSYNLHSSDSGPPAVGADPESITDYLQNVNSLLASNVSDSAVTFLYLPPPPLRSDNHLEYLHMLTTISEGLGPTLFIHGLSHVVSTTL